MASYLTPTELWRLARPGSIPLSSWAPGTVSAVAKTGTGSGTMTAAGYPLDAYAVRVRVVTGGEPGTAQVAVSLDGGVTYPSQSYTVPVADGLGLPLVVAGEVALTFTPGAAPSYNVGDLFAFGTTASPEILAQIDAASDEADGYLKNVFALPLQSWGVDLRRYVGLLARANLTANRGWTEAEAFVNARAEAEKWFMAVALGDLQPPVTEAAGGAVVFPEFVKTRGRWRTDWRI